MIFCLELLEETTPEIILCHSCGTSLEIETKRFVATNPLVTQGLIPDSLANILMPPIDQNQNGQKKKSSKIITEARVLTGYPNHFQYLLRYPGLSVCIKAI